MAKEDKRDQLGAVFLKYKDYVLTLPKVDNDVTADVDKHFLSIQKLRCSPGLEDVALSQGVLGVPS